MIRATMNITTNHRPPRLRAFLGSLALACCCCAHAGAPGLPKDVQHWIARARACPGAPACADLDQDQARLRLQHRQNPRAIAALERAEKRRFDALVQRMRACQAIEERSGRQSPAALKACAGLDQEAFKARVKYRDNPQAIQRLNDATTFVD